MMKKVLAIILVICIWLGVAFAGAVNERMIATTQLDDSPTSVTAERGIQDFQRVAFFVRYDETEVGESLKAVISIYVSDDGGNNWANGRFFDYAGGTTPQATEEISSDGNYYFWLDPNVAVQQIRVACEGYNTDADDLISISVDLIGYK